MTFWTTILTFAQTTTERVGNKLSADFGQVQASSEKADGSLVTQSDQWADQTLREAIATAFPSHGVLSEEAEHLFPATDWCWVIDPLDGTTNFTRGIPIWGISLGLLYQGTPVFGYVHFPLLAQSFYGFWSAASQPTQAFLNQKPICTSTDAVGHNDCFSICTRSLSVLNQPFPCKIRLLGAVSYNFLLVAAGATLGGVEATPKIWDIAAAWPIVRAAGGVWVPLDSEPFPLRAGENYGDRAYPTLAVSQAELVPIFQPLVQSLSQSSSKSPYPRTFL
jgi:myo-inositol-1(or 4)-monophosphatase